MPETRYIVRNVRIDEGLDSHLKAIARAEERTISQVIKRLLKEGSEKYFSTNPEMEKYLKQVQQEEILTAMKKAKISMRELPLLNADEE